MRIISKRQVWFCFCVLLLPESPRYNFILNDLARLIIWIVIGLLFYLAFEQKDCKKAIKVIGTLVMIILTVIISVPAIGFMIFWWRSAGI